VSSPNTNTTQNEYVYGNYLHGLACASASDCWAVGNVYNAQTLVLRRYTPVTPPAPLSAVSRKTHGSVGTFDVDLKAPAPGIECRAGGTSGDHQVVISFANSVSVGGVSVSSKDSMATATQSVSDKVVTVDLHNVTNVQTLTITLTNVSDQTNSGDLSISMGVLIGDTTADKFVNSADISQTKSQSGTAVTSSNFGEDLNADGSINSADIALAKSKSGTALP
jgi:hypothetical protein